MPVYVVRNQAELVHFYPILRYLYANAEMFNILKLRHGGAQCAPGSWRIMRKSLTHLYLIYINPQLAIQMRRLLIHLRNSILPTQDQELHSRTKLSLNLSFDLRPIPYSFS